MRIKKLFLGALLALFLMPVNNTFASAQDFYFKDFTADYYLTKLEDGTSKLHVKEVLTAVFPLTNQNHGISRNIPFYNQDGANRTIASKSAMNLTVLRNGQPEEINKIEIEDDYYAVYIGSADEYVHGEQVYTLEYDFTDVITEFNKYGKNVSGKEDEIKTFQELYWDTNGTGWKQKFNKLTANLHIPEDVYKNIKLEDTKCYVGSYGEKGEDRCSFMYTNDCISFTTYNLAKGENLTFAVDFKPDTFKVILEDNYILIVALVIEIIIILIVIIRKYLKWAKTAKPQRILYKSTFVAPQYQPPEDENVHVAEGEKIYLKKTKSSYVATLLELAVSKKITIKKVEGEKKYKWIVTLNVEPGILSGPQKEMLNILSGNGGFIKGDEIPIEKHSATRYLASCATDYNALAEKKLETNEYLNPSKNYISTGSFWWLSFGLMGFVSIAILDLGRGEIFNVIGELVGSSFSISRNSIVIGGDNLPFIMFVIFIASMVAAKIFSKRTRTYARYTDKGIELVRYLEGLELYIKMAEEDRLKFLQSVEGADTSTEGIVKLYEKLLPWASLFGAEESWVRELGKYYEIEDIEETISTDVLRGIMIADISRDLNRTISSSTHYIEPSSGGGSSSSFSGGGGGGGGGSSGGGGGGGGGGGW